MNKQIFILVFIAILAVGGGVWLSQYSSKDKFDSELLFAGLQASANQVDCVEIKNAQGALFSAQKLGDTWLATIDPEQPVYPISQRKLADFVETMMRMKLVEAKTSKPKNYIHLGLQSIDINDSMASLVTLKAKGKSWQVLVGNKVSSGAGHYILKPEDSQSWRTDKIIHLPIDKFSWLKQPILPFQAKEIFSVSRTDAFNWKLSRDFKGNFQLLDMPQDSELEYDSILDSIVNSLTSLDFEKLIVADEQFTKSLHLLTQLEVVATEQNVFQVMVSELEGKHFVSFSSAQQLEYWHKWHYQVSSFSAQQLIKKLDDFLAEENIIPNSEVTSSSAIDEGYSPL